MVHISFSYSRSFLSIILLVIFSVSSAETTAAYEFDKNSTVLTAHKTTEKINLDGIGDEKSWHEANTLITLLKDGSIGDVPLSLKALYDTENIYFLAVWPDNTKDVSPKKWVFDSSKKEWVTQTFHNDKGEIQTADEDRLMFFWNIDDSVRGFNTAGCGMICHGDRMHTNSPEERIDSWHWKAGRSNPLGHVEDKWLNDSVTKGYGPTEREAARHNDSAESLHTSQDLQGLYTANSETYEVDAKTIKAPRYWEPNATGEDALFITADEIANGEAVEITDSSELDRNRSIPGYILYKPSGSRADIKVAADWQGGFWTLEIQRPLVTGNKDDVQFDLTKLYRFGIAVSDNDGGFEAHGIGHSFDLGARTLEFGGIGSEEITTMAMVNDHLLVGRHYIQKNKTSLAISEINLALSLFNDKQQAIAELDPKTYISIKSDFTEAKRLPTVQHINGLIKKIDKAILILQGKIPPQEATLLQKGIAWWGTFQIYFLIFLGFVAIFPIYNSLKIMQKDEFRVMGFFLVLIFIPIILESIGRIGMLFHVFSLKNLSFMTSEYATFLWAVLVTVALFVARKSYNEIYTVLTSLELQRDKLKELSITDELTGLYNRRHFNRRLSEYLTMARRFDSTMSLTMLDLDNFKEINDTYGHICGDEMLKHVTDILLKTIRKKIDVLARFGGEEFAIISYRTTENSITTLAERLRTEIEKSPLYFDGKEIWITASLGIANAPSPDIFDENDLIDKADRALYDAKRSGKNCVKMWYGIA